MNFIYLIGIENGGGKGEYLKTHIKGEYYLTDILVNRPRIRYVLPNDYISNQSIVVIENR